jgi:hypothetical protein
LADELDKIEGQDEALAIRANVRLYDLQIPEPSAPAHPQSLIDYSPRPIAEPDAQEHERCSYVRSSNNQVSEQIETHIQELLRRGWTKSAIARALRLNCRVVIRVARETTQRRSAQSAQSASNGLAIDLGKS